MWHSILIRRYQRLHINRNTRALHHSEEKFNFHQSGKTQTPNQRCLQCFSRNSWWFYFYWVLTVAPGEVGWQIWALTLAFLIPHSCIGGRVLFLGLCSLGRYSLLLLSILDNLSLLSILDYSKEFRNNDSFVHSFSEKTDCISHVQWTLGNGKKKQKCVNHESNNVPRTLDDINNHRRPRFTSGGL